MASNTFRGLCWLTCGPGTCIKLISLHLVPLRCFIVNTCSGAKCTYEVFPAQRRHAAFLLRKAEYKQAYAGPSGSWDIRRYFLNKETNHLLFIKTFSSVPLRKNAVCALQIICNYFLLPCKIHEEITVVDDQCSSITKESIYHIKHVHTTFYHSSGLTRNLMFNGSIYYVLFLQILCFNLLGQSWGTED